MSSYKSSLIQLKKQVREEIVKYLESSLESSVLLGDRAMYLNLLIDLENLSLDKLPGSELNELAKIVDFLHEGLQTTVFAKSLQSMFSSVKESEQSNERSNTKASK